MSQNSNQEWSIGKTFAASSRRSEGEPTAQIPAPPSSQQFPRQLLQFWGQVSGKKFCIHDRSANGKCFTAKPLHWQHRRLVGVFSNFLHDPWLEKGNIRKILNKILCSTASIVIRCPSTNNTKLRQDQSPALNDTRASDWKLNSPYRLSRQFPSSWDSQNRPNKEPVRESNYTCLSMNDAKEWTLFRRN